MLARQHRQQRYPARLQPVPCAIPACPNRAGDKAGDRGHLCPRHRKHKARTGSPIHPGLTVEARRPAVKAIGRIIRQQLKRQDLNTKMMVHELTRLLHDLPPGLPRLNELRGRTPFVKAQTILFHLNRQRWTTLRNPRTRTPKTERTFAIRLLSLCMASELLAPPVCGAPMYVKTQVCQGLYAELWLRKLQVFEVENGRGGVTRTVIYNHRPSSIQSAWTVRRLYEMLSPCYLDWYARHEDQIREAIPASTYTPQ
jgi:hypothetical protein